ADAPAALARIEGGHVCGKIVTTLSAEVIRQGQGHPARMSWPLQRSA
ncbi:MAG: hypothetical protein ACI9EF_001312, partial [Pseudohongiellaceae bacterium]